MTRRLGAFAASAALLFVLSGCGSDGSTSSSETPASGEHPAKAEEHPKKSEHPEHPK